LHRLPPVGARIADGRVPVLCCFEKPNDPPNWCHRSLVADWIERTLGQPVREIGFETLTKDLHPLRPPPVFI
jgi:hypothetical protein